MSLRSRVSGLTLREMADLLWAGYELLRAQRSLKTSDRGALLAPAQAAAPAPELTPVQRRRAGAIGWAISRAAHYGPLRAKCLARSLALLHLLQRNQVPGGRLHLGVRKTEAGLMAHAWITLEGRVLGDEPGFVADFTELPGTTAVDLL